MGKASLDMIMEVGSYYTKPAYKSGGLMSPIESVIIGLDCQIFTRMTRVLKALCLETQKPVFLLQS